MLARWEKYTPEEKGKIKELEILFVLFLFPSYLSLYIFIADFKGQPLTNLIPEIKVIPLQPWALLISTDQTMIIHWISNVRSLFLVSI